MNRNLKIEEQTYDYLGFLYRVRVGQDQSVCWELWMPEAKEAVPSSCGTIRASRSARKPYKAVKEAHANARKWIDTWLNTHFALETAMNQFADRYAKSRTEFPKHRRIDQGGEFNHGPTA
jgi:hypothetical protein